MRHLITRTDVFRVDTVAEVEQLHAELKEADGFELVAFSYKTKEIKSKAK